MALTQLTKIDGGGISTTSDYRVGIITASKFVGPFDGSAGNFTGIITATGANFSGNVSIGGTLTYEDVTNIDSVGIITAQSDIHVGGGVSAVGVGTFGSLDIGGDIDVDGHTNLDNVSIAGVTTMGQTTISHTGAPQLIIKDSDTTGSADSNGISFVDASNTQYGFIGQSGSSHTMLINLTNTINPIRLQINNSTKLEIGNTGVYVDNANFFVNSGNNAYLSGEVHIADSIIHSGDTNTKIRFPAADTFSVETAGNERFRITSAGDVGISSSSPRAKLDIKDANTGKNVILRVSADNNTPYALVVGNDTFNTTDSRGLAMWIGSNKVHHIEARTSTTASENELKISATDAIHFGTGSSQTERLRIKSDGTITINSTASQPSTTVSGYQFDGVAGTFRLSTGAGSSGTTSGSISIIGANHNSNIENGANSGAAVNLFNANNNNGNSTSISFHNADSLSSSRILGLNVNHATRKGDLVFMTSNGSHPTEKARITSDGKIGINETTPIARLHVKNGESNAAGYAHDTVVVEDSDHAFLTFLTGTSGSSGINFGDAGDPQRGVIQYDQSNDYMRFITAASERARINSDGVVSLNSTYAGSTTNGSPIMLINPRVTGSNTMGIKFQARADVYNVTHIQFEHAVNQQVMGSITSANAGATSYNTSSDYRLKENQVAISDGIARLKTLKPYRFNFKVDPDKTVDGFFAHEVAPVIPEAVTGEKDAVEMQQMDQSKLVPLLTAALQEEIVKREEIEAKYNALEARISALEGS